MNRSHRCVCNDCGRILTEGPRRLRSANFDSSIRRKKKSTRWTVYAFCDACYERRTHNKEIQP